VIRRRPERFSALLDGELSPRAARRLEAEPRAREEIEGLASVGEWVREAQAARAGDVPDLWPGVAARLAALDAERVGAEGQGLSRRPSSRWLGPALAAAAAAAAALVLWLAAPIPVARAGDEVVQWLDTQGHPVMVIEAEDEATIIWVLGAEVEDLSRAGGDDVA